MPPPVAGYYAWYDASQITGLSDGATVTTWPDLSGHGFDLNTSGGTPVYYSTTSAQLLNGLPVVRFNANAYLASGTAMSSSQPFTIFAVLKRATITTTDYVCGTGASATFMGGTTTQWTMYNGGSFVSGGTTDTLQHIFTSINSGTGTLRIDGAQVGTGSIGSTGLTSNFVVGDHWASASSGHNWNGPVGELIVYNTTLTLAQTQSVEAYLQAKWFPPATFTGTASLPLGPLTVTSTGTSSTSSGTASLPLGPLTLTVTGGVFGATLPLGPLTLTSTSITIAVPIITLGPLTLTCRTGTAGGSGTLAFIRSTPK